MICNARGLFIRSGRARLRALQGRETVIIVLSERARGSVGLNNALHLLEFKYFRNKVYSCTYAR